MVLTRFCGEHVHELQLSAQKSSSFSAFVREFLHITDLNFLHGSQARRLHTETQMSLHLFTQHFIFYPYLTPNWTDHQWSRKTELNNVIFFIFLSEAQQLKVPADLS